MSEQLYSVVSEALRYLFVFLGALILLRSFFLFRRERNTTRRQLHKLPDAGNVGEWVILYGSDEYTEGTCVPVPREGNLGYVRSCDISLPCEGIHRIHFDFTFENGLGLLIRPRSGCTVLVDGIEFTCRTDPRFHPLVHGSVLQVGNIVLRLRLFAGVNIQREAAYANDPAPVPMQEQPLPMPEPGPDPTFMPPAYIPYPEVPMVPAPPQPESPATPPLPRPRRSDRWKGDWSE